MSARAGSAETAADHSTMLLRANHHQASPSPDATAGSDAASDLAASNYNDVLLLASHRSSVRKAYYLNQLLMVCGGANAADAVEILAVSFILPSAEDDLSLTGVEKGWLAGVIFAGMLIGGVSLNNGTGKATDLSNGLFIQWALTVLALMLLAIFCAFFFTER
jgi:hypothetical protein